jgi:phosphoglycolate phosphatase
MRKILKGIGTGEHHPLTNIGLRAPKMTPPKIEAIIFDFDGTLAELWIDFGEMKQRLALLTQKYSLPHPPPGLPALEGVENVVTQAKNENPLAVHEFVEKARKLILDMELEAAYQASLFPFTRSIFMELDRRCVKKAIITRNCEQAVRIVFSDVDDYCDCLLARDHVSQVKPNPNHLLQALRMISAFPETTLMVGDHPLDIETGKRARVWTAGVWSGKASQANLLQSGAHWAAPNCEVLISLLTEQAII